MSSSLIVKFSGIFSSTYIIVYWMLKRMTLHVGSTPMGLCDSREKPSKMNSCWSCLTIVGVLVRKFVGGEIVMR